MANENKGNVKSDTMNKYVEFMQAMIAGIDVNQNKEWAREMGDISSNIRNALVGRLRKIDPDTKFLDYCNGIKALLTIYNFGNLDTIREDDKDLIKTGIRRILDHVVDSGYDITPNLEKTTCQEIFGDDDNNRDDNNKVKVVPITISVTTVFTTLVYFRRAFKRMKLFTEEELVLGDIDLNKRTVETVSHIMYLFYTFAYEQKPENRFSGWGVTLDRSFTKAVTLSDTYAVVDALGRFADAFTKDGDKKDKEFTKSIDEYAVSRFGNNYAYLTDRCIESTFKTAVNVYDRTKSVYGKSVFYSDCQRDGENIRYNYVKTTYEQIASSSRSSALFNPLYVAMITMYGYNEKEVVIRRFMDSPELAQTFYDKYEKNFEQKNEDDLSLSQYAAKLVREEKSDDKNEDEDFDVNKNLNLLLDKQHKPMSKNYAESNDIIQGDSLAEEKATEEKSLWRSYYRVGRIFQKYLETHHPEELMKISDYRDYLNATKDAIDQVQIMYRDFDNHQRLGVVDTDYANFTAMDVSVASDDISSIAKLNKANLAVNNLRPMLLSSKIMIVNALTKYPQADMKELYSAIKESRFTNVKRRKNAPPEKTREWLWNEDSVDMNSTARHCEAIMYDYFDYYEKYEFSFKSMQAFRDEIGEFIKNRVDLINGSIGSAEDIQSISSEFGQLKQLVLEITRQNVDLIRGEYQKRLAEKDAEIALANRNTEALKEELLREKEESKIRLQQQLSAIEESYKIGETVRGWIRAEFDNYIQKSMSMAVINILNGKKSIDQFDFSKLYNKGTDIIDANFDIVRNTWKSILDDCNDDPEKYDQKIDEYNNIFKKVIAIQQILSAASNGMLENDYYKQLGREDTSISERNAKIKREYRDQRRTGVAPKVPNNDKKG